LFGNSKKSGQLKEPRVKQLKKKAGKAKQKKTIIEPNNYRIGNLPLAWQTTDWPSLLTLCRNYYNSVNPKGSPSRECDPSGETHNQHMAQQKKVRDWFLDPVKYCKEIEKQQKKYPDKYVIVFVIKSLLVVIPLNRVHVVMVDYDTLQMMYLKML
jgi:hypothetical protein